MSNQPSPDDTRHELERLRSEVARLEAALGEEPRTPLGAESRSDRWRPVVASVCILLAAVLAPLAVVAQWANSEVSDTDRYVETMAPLASDPAVQDAVVARITDEIVTRLDIETVIDDAVDALTQRGLSEQPAAALTALTGPLATGVTNFVESQVRRLVTSDAFEEAWIAANRAAHEQVVALLTGDTGGTVEVSGSTVQLNLGPLIDIVKQQLIDAGFSLAERLPPITAQFTLFESEDIASAQTAFRLLDAAATWLPVLAVVLLGIGIAVSRSRRVALLFGALALAVSMIVLGAALNFFRIVYLDAVPADQLPADAAAAIYDTIALFIRLHLRALLLMGIVALVAAWLAGNGRAPTAIRHGANRALDAVRRGSDRAGLDPGRVGELTYSLRMTFRVIVVAAVLVIYAMRDYPTAPWTLGLLLIAGVVLLVVELVARPPAATEPATDRTSMPVG